MSHALSRVADAQQERCAQREGICPVCEREAASVAFCGCCSRQCEEGAHRALAAVAVVRLSICGAVAPGLPFVCTLDYGHAGNHVAEGTQGQITNTWSNRGAA